MALFSFNPPRVAAVVIAINGDVPLSMNAGGVEGDPALYIVGDPGPYDHNLLLARVGDNTSWNELRIQNSSTLELPNFAPTGGLQIGVGSSANNNRTTVTGPGSTVTSLYRLNVGQQGNANSMVIENGGAAIISDISSVGQGVNTDHTLGNLNSLTVTDAGSLFQVNSDLNIGLYGSGNSMSIANGASVEITGGTGLYIGHGLIGNENFGNDNSLFITDDSSVLESSSTIFVGRYGSRNEMIVANGANVNIDGALIVGQGISGQPLMGNDNTLIITGMGSVVNSRSQLNIGSFGSGNSITIADGGLLILQNPHFGFNISLHEDSSENYLRFNGGIMAIEGDYLNQIEALILADKIQTWDPVNEIWVSVGSITGGNYFGYGYYETEEGAFALTGYDGLGGYTILGPIPEPRHFATLAGLLVLLFVIYRRRLDR